MCLLNFCLSFKISWLQLYIDIRFKTVYYLKKKQIAQLRFQTFPAGHNWHVSGLEDLLFNVCKYDISHSLVLPLDEPDKFYFRNYNVCTKSTQEFLSSFWTSTYLFASTVTSLFILPQLLNFMFKIFLCYFASLKYENMHHFKEYKIFNRISSQMLAFQYLGGSSLRGMTQRHMHGIVWRHTGRRSGIGIR